jgi:sialate O-acetylesterase
MVAVALAAMGLGLNAAVAEVRLPKVFGDHMVLQRDKPLTVWGWADPSEKVTVSLAGEKREVQANNRGEWKVVLPAMQAGGPHEMQVSGSSVVRFSDVLIGEVWLCSGQSNMEMGVGASKDAKEEIAAADYPRIRLLMVKNKWTPEPQSDCEGSWKVCSPKTLGEDGWGGFSAAAYYFGRELHKQLAVPVGLIDSSWGGTRIESWTPPEGFAAVPALRKESERVQMGDPRTKAHQDRLGEFLATTEKWLTEAKTALNQQKLVPGMPTYPAELQPPTDLQHATALFNGMIHPLCPFALRGAIWYQGESNSREGMLYTERMKALVGGWRQIWGLGDFPFYFVQIAPFNYGGSPEFIGEFWEAQAAAGQEIPNCGMVVINDIGDVKDIHPTNKQEVGRRLALWALARDYDRPNVVYSGPTYKSMSVEGGKLRVTFDNAGTGLASRDGKPLSWFELIDAEEGGFVAADAQIDGSSVILSSPEVKNPVAMRFAWSMMAEPNLMNSDKLPAGAFRAGKIPQRDLLAMKVPEAKKYTLIYDLDLAKLGKEIRYDVDNRAKVNQPFDRVAYFLELQGSGGNTDYVYVSCDAFTDSLDKIGVPIVSSGARFQQNVANLTVISNVKNLKTGANLSGGNIEFWPNNYGTANSAGVPNASDQTYDFGDQPGDPADGYGCMQIHNHDARQVVFAVNHWGDGGKADIGIGNQASGNSDWTFSANAESYTAKRLRVFVRTK